MKLNEAQAEAVVSLQNSREFPILLEALNAYRHELLEFVMFGQEDNVHTYRGMARAVTEVLRTLGSAHDTLTKMRSRR